MCIWIDLETLIISFILCPWMMRGENIDERCKVIGASAADTFKLVNIPSLIIHYFRLVFLINLLQKITNNKRQFYVIPIISIYINLTVNIINQRECYLLSMTIFFLTNETWHTQKTKDWWRTLSIAKEANMYHHCA